MDAREAVLGKIRNALGARDGDTARIAAVSERISGHAKGIIPARGQIEASARLRLFIAQAEAVDATTEILPSYAALPGAVAAYLRSFNLPAAIRMGDDARLARAPFEAEPSLEVRKGPSDGKDMAGLSHADAGVAETGTLVLRSGADNPTTINFLSEYHIVVLRAADIAGDLESVWAVLRGDDATGAMPRTVNLVTGPSRSGDIEQTLLLGAHGPRALHIVIVEEDSGS